MIVACDVSCLHQPGCLVEVDKQVLRERSSLWQQPWYLAAVAALQSTSITFVLATLQILSCHKTAQLQSEYQSCQQDAEGGMATLSAIGTDARRSFRHAASHMSARACRGLTCMADLMSIATAGQQHLRITYGLFVLHVIEAHLHVYQLSVVKRSL